MFTIPTLPTDSLYKFLFVGGLVMVLGANYLNEKSFQDYTSISLRNDSLDLRQKPLIST
jgi:hypothetical protein